MVRWNRVFICLSLVCWASPLLTQTSYTWLLTGIERLAAGDYSKALTLLEAVAKQSTQSAVTEAWVAHGYHLQRRLDEASVHYKRVLELEAPRTPVDPAKRAAMLRFAPRVYQ